jgi:putative glutamine amidotransferase
MKSNKTQQPIIGILLDYSEHEAKFIQDLPKQANEKFACHEQSYLANFVDYNQPCHQVKIDKNSQFGNIINEDFIYTNSSHRQAVVETSISLKVSGITNDGIIEAIEKPFQPFCIGVQWHPEYHSTNVDIKIFKEFVDKSQSFLQNKI